MIVQEQAPKTQLDSAKLTQSFLHAKKIHEQIKVPIMNKIKSSMPTQIAPRPSMVI